MNYKQLFDAVGCRLEPGALHGHNGLTYHSRDGVWTSKQDLSPPQHQTSTAFAFKWRRKDSFDSPAVLSKARAWLQERYGDVCALVYNQKQPPVLLDAGCGAAFSALELFGPCFADLHYVGVDVSDAVHVARERVAERGHDGLFIRESLMKLPFAPGSFDIIFSEGVLHHTDSTRDALHALAPLLRPGGHLLFYVYNKKGPIREFTDDYIREQLRSMSASEAWEAVASLTRLGIELGEKEIELDIKEAVPLLGIPAGKISLQRFVYWHIFKAFYDPSLDFEAMRHINFDWYAPENAHRQTPEEVRQWCGEVNLAITRMRVEPAGITVIAERGAHAADGIRP